MEDVFILSGVRTPVGRILGGLSSFSSPALGAIVIKEAVKRAGVKMDEIDEVIMGCVLPAGVGQAPARLASISAGLPPTVPSYTINKVCGSGLKAVMLAAQSIRAGDNEVVVAGGMESMSNAPHLLSLRKGQKYGSATVLDHMVHDGLWCSFNDTHMGNLAEYTARKAGITREEQDNFAYESHHKAVKAIEQGKFKDEIVPVELKTKKGSKIIEIDEGPRKDTSIEKLSALKPAFEKDGTVTAGNAPGLNDGASSLVVVSERFLKDKELKPLARITGYSVAFLEPKELFFAPIEAIKKLVKKSGYSSVNDWDAIEINEAFSAQILADGKALNIDWSKVNVNGGAVALGHPIGASGARILVTLIHTLKQKKAKTGLSALCLGGGGAVAMGIEII